MALKVNNKILKTIRYTTGNQCRALSNGVSDMTKFTFFKYKTCSRVLDSSQFLNRHQLYLHVWML